MLVLRGLKDITPEALAPALKMFPNLIYLDLSDTGAAGSAPVIKVIGRTKYFSNLQILKLRQVRLGTGAFFSLLVGRGPRLWSLDVRNNDIQDDDMLEGVLEHCFMTPWVPPPSYQSLSTGDSTHATDALLEILPLNDRTRCSHTDHRLKNILKVDTEAYVKELFGRAPAINVGPELDNGLTHLYISGNKISVHTVLAFIKKGRLRVFDAGTVTPISVYHWSQLYMVEECAFWARCAETLWPNFNKFSLGSLVCFRISHHPITGNAELFDDGVIAGEKTYFVVWPEYQEDVMSLRKTIHLDIFRHIVKQLTGIRVLILTDVPLISHRGWMTRILIEFIDVSGAIPSSIEELCLELTNDSPVAVPKPKTPEDGPPCRKLSGGLGRAPGQCENPFDNPFVGDIEKVLGDYLASHKKWDGEVKFLHPRQEA
jgi:hypothetical protein